MKTHLPSLILAAALAGFTLPPASPTAHAQAQHGEAGTTKAPLPKPASLPDLWKMIDGHHAALTASVQGQRLAEVHEHAFAVRDAVAMLPGFSADLPADKKARVEGAVKNVARVAVDLDHSGDAGKQAPTEANLKKLDSILKQLRAQYGL